MQSSQWSRRKVALCAIVEPPWSDSWTNEDFLSIFWPSALTCGHRPSWKCYVNRKLLDNKFAFPQRETTPISNDVYHHLSDKTIYFFPHYVKFTRLHSHQEACTRGRLVNKCHCTPALSKTLKKSQSVALWCGKNGEHKEKKMRSLTEMHTKTHTIPIFTHWHTHTHTISIFTHWPIRIPIFTHWRTTEK